MADKISAQVDIMGASVSNRASANCSALRMNVFLLILEQRVSMLVKLVIGIDQMKKLLKKKYRRIKRSLSSYDLSQLVYFIPGLFLVLLALAMVTAPSLSIFFVAGFFMASGFCLCFIAWKLLLLKRKLESALRDVSGKIVIHGLDLAESFIDDDDDSDEDKKVTYH